MFVSIKPFHVVYECSARSCLHCWMNLIQCLGAVLFDKFFLTFTENVIANAANECSRARLAQNKLGIGEIWTDDDRFNKTCAARIAFWQAPPGISLTGKFFFSSANLIATRHYRKGTLRR